MSRSTSVGWYGSVLLILFCIILVSQWVAASPAFITPISKRFTSKTSSTFVLSSSSLINGKSFSSPAHNKKDDDDDERPKICIVGGGFGGLNTALTLSSLPWTTTTAATKKPIITLLDKKERFVFLPLLYELVVDDASIEEVAPTYKSLLAGTDISFVQCDVDGVDVQNEIVYASAADTLTGKRREQLRIDYDYLVIATGSDVTVQSIPGADKFALPFYTVEECFELKRRFNLLDSIMEDYSNRQLKVVVVGGGYAGVELALNTLEYLGKERTKVTLVHRGAEVLQTATEYNRKTGQDRLQKAGINVLTNTSVVEVLPTDHENDPNRYRCTVKVADKITQVENKLDADLLLWTAGSQPSNNQRGVLNSIIPRDKNGRIVTGPYLRAKGLSNVFAVGDCSRVKKKPYPATAQVAIQQAPVAAWNVYATLCNSHLGSGGEVKLLPFQYLTLGEMMTLGSDDATVSVFGELFTLSGETASIFRRLVYDVRMPTVQQGVMAGLESLSRRLLSWRERKRAGGKKGRRGKVINWR